MPRILSIFLIFILFSCSKTESQIENISPTDISLEKYLNAVNKIRAKGCSCGSKYYGPTTSLVWNQVLEKSAIFHSKDMFQNKYFAHNSANGDGPAERALAQGFKFSIIGENIFSSTGFSPDEEYVITSWKNSPTHCINLMNPAFKEMAVGKYENYWTQVLASK